MNKIILNIFFIAALAFSGYSNLFSVEPPENASKEAPVGISEYPGYHQHDGFYFRFLFNPFVGYGYAHSMQNMYPIDKSDYLMSFSFQIGYSLNQNIILTIGTDVQSIPSFINPLNLLPKAINPQKGSATNYDSTLIFNYLLGINYYFMPQNIYISLAMTLADLSYSQNNKYFSSADYGPGLQTSLGKEWWVDKNWGLGLALNVSYNYFPTSRAGYPVISPMQVFAIGLSFSATYN